MSQRLFIALQPPPEVRAALLALMGGVEGAHWQTTGQLHLTLGYLGHVDRHVAADVAVMLGRLRQDPIAVHLAGLGTFDAPRFGRIATLWVGAGPAAPLTLLASKVRQLARQAGAAVEARRFLPHITLARFSRHGAPPVALQRFLQSTVVPDMCWTADEAILFESRLGSGGAHYEPVDVFPFARPDWPVRDARTRRA